MSAPGIEDVILPLLHHSFHLRQFVSRESVIRSEIDCWLKPEFRFAFAAVHMHVWATLFARKEEEPILPPFEDGRTH
jgi:hypothetical protein